MHESRVQNAEAACTVAEEDLAVIQNQAVSDVHEAEIVLLLAERDMEKYKDGEYPSKVNAAQNEITLAEEAVSQPGDANSPADRMTQQIVEKLQAAERKSQKNV